MRIEVDDYAIEPDQYQWILFKWVPLSSKSKMTLGSPGVLQRADVPGRWLNIAFHTDLKYALKHLHELLVKQVKPRTLAELLEAVQGAADLLASAAKEAAKAARCVKCGT